MCKLKLIGFIFPHYLSRIFNQTEIDIINRDITLGYILSKVTNLRVEGQRDSNGILVDINNADIQADPFVHRGTGKFDLLFKMFTKSSHLSPLSAYTCRSKLLG